MEGRAAMTIYNSDSFSVVPEASGYQEPEQGLARDISVIYVSVDEAAPRPRPARGSRGALGFAARALHRMADYVDDVRHSLERARDGARS
jgi:hypothetical protein